LASSGDMKSLLRLVQQVEDLMLKA
jgi:hypothetical protein